MGLKLFPKRWNDFKMACSCPDWAVPCKHIAAVIYMMAQEIDTNPFLVFEMHNVHLISELEKRGVNLNQDSDINVPTLKQLLKPAKKATKEAIKEDGSKTKINFSQLNDIATSLFSFLESTPPFYDQGDFKEIYANEILRVQKALIRVFKRNLNTEEIFKNLEPINFTRRTKLNLKLDTSFIQIDKAKPTTLSNGVEFLFSIFLDCLINLYTSNTENQISQFFFKSTREKFSSVGQKGICGSIKSWLDRFYMSAKEYRGILTINELSEYDLSLSIAVEKNGDNDGEPIPLEEVITNEEFDSNRFEILREISLLSHFIRGLAIYINSQCEKPIIYKISEFGKFLVDIIPTIKLLNVKVILPKSMQELIRPKTSLRLKKKSDSSPAFMRLEDMLAFDWQIALGNELVSYDEFMALVSKTDRLVRFKGQYIYVSEADIEAINDNLDSLGVLLNKANIVSKQEFDNYTDYLIKYKNLQQLVEEVKDYGNYWDDFTHFIRNDLYEYQLQYLRKNFDIQKISSE